MTLPIKPRGPEPIAPPRPELPQPGPAASAGRNAGRALDDFTPAPNNGGIGGVTKPSGTPTGGDGYVIGESNSF